jgi:hypothetical protein
MIKIAGVKSNDKINFKEFIDFFYKVDWCNKNPIVYMCDCKFIISFTNWTSYIDN